MSNSVLVNIKMFLEQARYALRVGAVCEAMMARCKGCKEPLRCDLLDYKEVKVCPTCGLDRWKPVSFEDAQASIYTWTAVAFCKKGHCWFPWSKTTFTFRQAGMAGFLWYADDEKKVPSTIKGPSAALYYGTQAFVPAVYRALGRCRQKLLLLLKIVTVAMAHLAAMMRRKMSSADLATLEKIWIIS